MKPVIEEAIDVNTIRLDSLMKEFCKKALSAREVKSYLLLEIAMVAEELYEYQLIEKNQAITLPTRSAEFTLIIRDKA